MTGIYKITNLINGHCYIGQAVNIEKRLREHINDAFNENRREYNYPLSRAYRKYGVQNFINSVLEECTREELNEKEIYYINFYNSKNNGYNQTNGGNQHFVEGEKSPNTKLTDKEIFDIREEYNKHTPKLEVYEKYKHILSLSGFTKIWLGYSRKQVHMDVYTEENKRYWEYIKNISGRRLFTDKDIIDIRTRLKNGESEDSIYLDYQHVSKKREAFHDICTGKRYAHIKI